MRITLKALPKISLRRHAILHSRSRHEAIKLKVARKREAREGRRLGSWLCQRGILRRPVRFRFTGRGWVAVQRPAAWKN